MKLKSIFKTKILPSLFLVLFCLLFLVYNNSFLVFTFSNDLEKYEFFEFNYYNRIKYLEYLNLKKLDDYKNIDYPFNPNMSHFGITKNYQQIKLLNKQQIVELADLKADQDFQEYLSRLEILHSKNKKFNTMFVDSLFVISFCSFLFVVTQIVFSK